MQIHRSIDKEDYTNFIITGLPLIVSKEDVDFYVSEAYASVPELAEAALDNEIGHQTVLFSDIYGLTCSTTLVPYENMLERLEILTGDLEERYSEGIIVSGICIKISRFLLQSEVVADSEVKAQPITYSALIKRVHELKDPRYASLKPECDFMFSIAKDYLIQDPITNKNCLIGAVLVAYTGERWSESVRKAASYLVSNNNLQEVSKTISELCQWLSTHFKVTIKIYMLSSQTIIKKRPNVTSKRVLKKCTVNGKFQQISIMIYAGHAYGLVKKGAQAEYIKRITASKKGETTKEILRGRILQDSECVLANYLSEKYTYQRPINRSTLKAWVPTYNIGVWDIETCDATTEGSTRHAHVYAIAIKVSGMKDHVFTERNSRNGDVIDEFLYYLKANIKGNLVLFSHNGAKFDSKAIRDRVMSHKSFKLTTYKLKKSSLSEMKVRGKYCNILFRDSYYHLQAPLHVLGKAFDTENQKIAAEDMGFSHDSVNMENCSSETLLSKVIPYIKKDILTLYDILLAYNESINTVFSEIDRHLGTQSLYPKGHKWITECQSASGVAREILRYYFTQKYKEIPICNLSREMDDLIRPYYFGGMTEVLYSLGRIEGPLYYVDKTSHYPDCMSKYSFPMGKLSVTKYAGESLEGVAGLILTYVHHNRPLHDLEVPVIPVKDTAGRLVYAYLSKPVLTMVSIETYLYCLRTNQGYTFDIQSVLRGESQDKCYSDIVQIVYSLKAGAESKPLLQATKIAINSLYGILGLRYKTESVIFGEDMDCMKERISKLARASSLLSVSTLGNYKLASYENTIDTTDFMKIDHAFLVADYGRLELHKLICDIQTRGGTVYYCDTDSVISNLKPEDHFDVHNPTLNQPKVLGGLTNEAGFGGKYTAGVFLGLKFYALRHESGEFTLKAKGASLDNKYTTRTVNPETKEITFNGLSSTGQESVSFEDMVLIAEGYSLVMECMHFTDDPKTPGIMKTLLDKTFTQIYTKADFDPDTKIIKRKDITTLTLRREYTHKL